MSGGKPDKDSDEKRFNETVKRMLKTPPTPHDARPSKATLKPKCVSATAGKSDKKG